MKLLSILISLAMMLSGGYMAEDPNMAASTVITVRDAVISIDGEEYPLSPSIVLGAASENGAALLDVSMPLGEDVLFPVQVKIADSGLGMLLGESTTLYNLTPAFFDELLEGEEIPGEVLNMLDSYGRLLGAAYKLDQESMLQYQDDHRAKVKKLFDDAYHEDATFHADGKEQSGLIVDFELPHERVAGYLDYAYSIAPVEYIDAYFDYVNTVFGMSGMPEVDSVSDLLNVAGVTITLDGDLTYNDTSAAADLLFHITIDPAAMAPELIGESTEDAEVVSFDIPMEIIAHSATNLEYTMSMDIEGVQMNLTGTATDDSQSVSMTMAEDSADLMTMDMSILPLEDGSMQTVVDMNMFVDTVTAVFSVDGVANDEGSTTDFSFTFTEGDSTNFVNFAVDVAHDAITDRTADAAVVEINSLDELESNTGLMMAAMSLVGGAEKLMNDESIAALVELMNTSYEMEAAIEPDENMYETVGTEEISAEAVIPEFGWLPEGYEVSETSVQPDGYTTSVYLEKDLGDGDYSTIYIDLYAYNTVSSSATYAIVDGSAQPVDGPIITIERDEYDTIMASTDIDSIEIWLNCFEPGLSDEDIVRILTNISFSEAA